MTTHPTPALIARYASGNPGVDEVTPGRWRRTWNPAPRAGHCWPTRSRRPLATWSTGWAQPRRRDRRRSGSRASQAVAWHRGRRPGAAVAGHGGRADPGRGRLRTDLRALAVAGAAGRAGRAAAAGGRRVEPAHRSRLGTDRQRATRRTVAAVAAHASDADGGPADVAWPAGGPGTPRRCGCCRAWRSPPGAWRWAGGWGWTGRRSGWRSSGRWGWWCRAWSGTGSRPVLTADSWPGWAAATVALTGVVFMRAAGYRQLGVGRS